MNDNGVKNWWNSVKDNQYWSGAVVGVDWDDLWDQAKEEIKEIYSQAANSCHD